MEVKKHMKMRMLPLFAAALLLLTQALAGCEKKPEEKDMRVKIWSAPATEKILQDYEYENVATSPAIDLLTAKGEYESGQIILTAQTDIDGYDISAGDLTLLGGSKTYPKENILIYNQKYINVVNNYEANNAPTGMYPDAILPFDAAKAHGENKIENGNNQGIYITFNTPATQQAGIYTGNITVKYGSKQELVPVRLEVVDLTVSAKNNAKSIFLTQWSFESGELDSTQDMYNKYTDMLIDYRLSPHVLTTDTLHSDSDISYYTELAYSYLIDPRCSNIAIPYNTVTVDGELCIDAQVFKKYLKSFAQKSFDTNFNMLEKSVCYFGIIDEPYLEIYNRVKVVSRVFDETIAQTADEIQNGSSISPIKNQVVESIRNLKNVVTSQYVSELDGYIDTWCPLFQHYDTAEKRELYANQQEKWWYGCIYPRAPYPTYHTEDTLISARAAGWMQAEYDVVGNLFWAANNYAVYDGTKYSHLDDYYGTASRFPNVNGDGYLFYPGKQYGLDKPVASLRLEAIRDGLEEYELLLAMKNRYLDLASTHGFEFDFSGALSGMTSFIYSGTQVFSDSGMFYEARKSLLTRALLANSDAGVCFIDQSDDSYGNITYKIFIKDGHTLKVNQVTPNNVQSVDGGKIYTCVFRLSENSNSFELSVTSNGQTQSFTVGLGGKVAVKEAAELQQSFSKEGVTPSITKVNAADIDSSLQGELIKLSLPATTKGKSQSFKMTDNVFSEIGSNSSKVILHIYKAAGGQKITLGVSAKYTNYTLYVDIDEYTLKNGLNSIEIPLTALKWERLGKLESLVFYINDNSAQPARDIYFKDIVVYNK